MKDRFCCITLGLVVTTVVFRRSDFPLTMRVTTFGNERTFVGDAKKFVAENLKQLLL